MTNRELKVGGRYLVMVERRLYEAKLTRINRGARLRETTWECLTDAGQTLVLRSTVQFKGVCAPV